MTPRLNKYGRQHETKNRTRGGYSYFSNCPSPAERLRQRRKARAAVMRFHRAKNMADMILAEKDRRENRMIYLNHIYVQNQMESFEATVPDWSGPSGELPQSRGTTTKENNHA